MSPEDFARTGERICNLKKAFNIREGWQSADDWLPVRAMRDAMPSGPGQGVHMEDDELRIMIDSYYAARGWTEDGLIPSAKLDELGMADIAADIGVDARARERMTTKPCRRWSRTLRRRAMYRYEDGYDDRDV